MSWIIGFILGCIGIYLLFLLFKNFGGVVLRLLFYTGIAVLAILAIYLIYRAAASLKRRSRLSKELRRYRAWLDAVGICSYESTPYDKACWQEAAKKHFVIQIDDDHAISITFGEKVVNQIHQAGLVRQTELWKICQNTAPEFQTSYTQLLMDFLQEKGQSIILSPPNRQKYCLTFEYLTVLEQILLDNDAKSVQEYLLLCWESEEMPFVDAIDETLIYELLRYMTTLTDELIVSRAQALLVS